MNWRFDVYRSLPGIRARSRMYRRDRRVSGAVYLRVDM